MQSAVGTRVGYRGRQSSFGLLAVLAQRCCNTTQHNAGLRSAWLQHASVFVELGVGKDSPLRMLAC